MKKGKVEIKRNPEVVAKSKVYIPPGAPRLNMKAEPEEAPLTLYEDGRMEGQEWVKKILGKKED